MDGPGENEASWKDSDGSMKKSRSSNSVLSVLKVVFVQHRVAAICLASGAFVSALIESTILAIVAHAATAMVNGDEEIAASLGPVGLDTSLSTALAIAGGLALARLLLQLPLSYLPARIAADTQAQIRDGLFDAYSRASWAVQSEERDGHLQELLTSQTVQATQSMVYGTTLVVAGLTFATLVLAAFALGPVTALLVLLVAMCLFGLLRPIAKQGRRYAAMLSAAQLDYANAIGGSVRMAEETYAFGTAASERDRVRHHTYVSRDLFLRMQFATRLTQGLYRGLVIFLLVGGLAVLHAIGAGQIASLGTIILILVRASSYGQTTQVTWQGIHQAWPYLERLTITEERYLDGPPVEGDESYPEHATLRLEDVSFAYHSDRETVLDEVNLSIEHGDVVGIVGPSGAGKSTLVQMLLRMRNPTTGRILLGNVPVDQISLADWRRHVAYVPQEPRLLDASVLDNIRFMRDIDQATIETAARQAHIHDAIMAMPDGYDTMIGQRVDAVSGGQRQRLCIARSLAGRPSVMVLDEPTSALDMASEAAIQRSLLELRGELTMFIVTHRESMLEICNRVIEVDSGRATVGMSI